MLCGLRVMRLIQLTCMPPSESGHPAAVFIGPMASGKTKLGKRVARILDLPFVDTDRMIAERHGEIPTIFAEQGEAGFRRLERDAVIEAMTTSGVVSLGGGAVLDEYTRRDLLHVPVIYLHVTPEAVATRLKTSTRPLLRDGIDGWTAIFESRKHIYESLADIDFDTSQAHLGDIAETVAAWIREQENLV